MVAALLTAEGCAVRQTTRVSPAQMPAPPAQASLSELVERVNARSALVTTLVATVDLEPTAGSVYTGVIREYRDVRGFLLVEKPAKIRLVGQAPVLRTNIFDMASDGEEFRVYIPSKQKFVVGKTSLQRPAKNSLENLRPQHILEALLISAVDPAREACVQELAEDAGRRYWVLMVLDRASNGDLSLTRKVWFEGPALEIRRMQLYGPQGAYVEDVRYSAYQDSGGVRYPTRIEVSRPQEDYRLAITLLKATFNEPIAPEKFDLQQPEGAERVEVAGGFAGEGGYGQ